MTETPDVLLQSALDDLRRAYVRVEKAGHTKRWTKTAIRIAGEMVKKDLEELKTNLKPRQAEKAKAQ